MEGNAVVSIIALVMIVAIPYALALWMKRIGNKGRMLAGQAPIAGIGRLLLDLIVWMIVIKGVISFGALVVDFDREEATYLELQHFALWVTIKAYTSIAWVVAASV